MTLTSWTPQLRTSLTVESHSWARRIGENPKTIPFDRL